jgi:hypothetical protein
VKTNQRRSFVDPGSFRDYWEPQRTKRLTGEVVWGKNIGNDFTKGHRGAARSKSGLKKYLRVMERLDGKKLCRSEE